MRKKIGGLSGSEGNSPAGGTGPGGGSGPHVSGRHRPRERIGEGAETIGAGWCPRLAGAAQQPIPRVRAVVGRGGALAARRAFRTRLRESRRVWLAARPVPQAIPGAVEPSASPPSARGWGAGPPDLPTRAPRATMGRDAEAGPVFLGRTVAILSRLEAQRLGRLGGIESSRPHKGDSAWGRALVRHQWQKRGGRAQKRHYPGLWRIWLENARRARLGRPLIPVPLVRTPAANRMRALRQLRKARAEYERARAHGVPLPQSPRPRSFLAS